VPLTADALAQCRDFIVGRMRNDWLDQGYPYDVIDAVLGAQSHDPYAAFQAVKALAEWTKREDWREILPAFARCVRITRDQKLVYEVDESRLKEPAELALNAALRQAEGAERRAASVQDFFKVFLPLIPLINHFFDEVLVMSEVEVERQNRLALLQRIVRLGTQASDFSRLEGF
jgi:glycyl-tRNA synthetase